MLDLKKVTLAVIALSSGAVMAGTMGPVCAPGDVTIPCVNSGWDVGVQALYLKPSYSFGPFTQTSSLVSGTIDFPINQVTTYNNNNLKWGWGFKLEGSYHFNSGNDVDVNWYHLNHSLAHSYAQGTGLTAIADNLTGFTYFSDVENRINSRWDAVNLELGQHVDFAALKNMRLHGGFQYANIKTAVKTYATSPSAASALGESILDAVNSNATLKYNGFGPRVGADLSYGWDHGIAIYANGAAALLVGTRQFVDTTLAIYNGSGPLDLVGVSATTYTSGSSTQVIPELEGKVGLSYDYAMAHGEFRLDAGWMWVNYLHALSTGATFTTANSDFGVQGPYVGLKWTGNFV